MHQLIIRRKQQKQDRRVAPECQAHPLSQAVDRQIEIAGAAVVARNPDGRVDVKSEIGDAPYAGTASGGLVGLLIGIIGGPLGVLIGGTYGMLVGSLFDIEAPAEEPAPAASDEATPADRDQAADSTTDGDTDRSQDDADDGDHRDAVPGPGLRPRLKYTSPRRL